MGNKIDFLLPLFCFVVSFAGFNVCHSFFASLNGALCLTNWYKPVLLYCIQGGQLKAKIISFQSQYEAVFTPEKLEEPNSDEVFSVHDVRVT